MMAVKMHGFTVLIITGIMKKVPITAMKPKCPYSMGEMAASSSEEARDANPGAGRS